MFGENLRSAVLISAIGIGLVFGVIVALWGLMVLVVRVTADHRAADGRGSSPPMADDAEEEARRRRAVAVVAAVTTAVEHERQGETAKARAAAAAVGAYITSEARPPDDGL